MEEDITVILPLPGMQVGMERVLLTGTKGITFLNMELKAASPADWVVSKFMCKYPNS